MTDADQEQLIADHFLFDKPVSPLLTCAGMARDWPDARGIWHNDNKDFLVSEKTRYIINVALLWPGRIWLCGLIVVWKGHSKIDFKRESRLLWVNFFWTWSRYQTRIFYFLKLSLKPIVTLEFRSGSTRKIISALSQCKRMVICKPAGNAGPKVSNSSRLTSRRLVPSTCTTSILATFSPAHPTSVRSNSFV